MSQTSPMRVEPFSYQNIQKTFLWPGEWEHSTSNRFREMELFSGAIATGARGGKNAHKGGLLALDLLSSDRWEKGAWFFNQ